jgi:hypothetical protein
MNYLQVVHVIVRPLVVHDVGVITDIDTVEDLQRAEKILKTSLQ